MWKKGEGIGLEEGMKERREKNRKKVKKEKITEGREEGLKG